MTSETRTIDYGGIPLVCYSQPEIMQDEWVIRKLKGLTGGFFIEIGAYDGVYHSNTLTLERDLGWRGILIEASHEAAAKAAEARPHAIVIEATLSRRRKEGHFYVAGQCSGLAEYMRPSLLAANSRSKRVPVWTTTLQKVLQPYGLPPVVDYLSIDVEGAEFAVLSSYFRSNAARQFRCMTIETGRQQNDLDRLIHLLHPRGYRLDLVREWEAFFINPSLISS